MKARFYQGNEVRIGMKKKILGIILAMTMMFGLTACGSGSNVININEVITSPDSKLVDFEIVENNFYGAILVDKNTNVMYYWITCSSGGLTPIYNEDGTLRLYEE